MAMLEWIALILCVLASFDNHAGRVGALDIGVCYGTLGNDLPAATDVVNLYKRYGISKMRLFDPNPAVLNALKGSGIGVTIDIPNDQLQLMATNQAAVEGYFRDTIRPYVNDVTINYIAVGNEVELTAGGSAALSNILPVMQFFNQIAYQYGIKVTTVLTPTVVASSSPPSTGAFKPETKNAMSGILEFLKSTDSPLMLNVYPYFTYKLFPGSVRLDYALFTAKDTVIQDGQYAYRNLFDATIDSFIAAMEKVGRGDVRIVVGESGWPSGGSGSISTPELAATYNKNYLNHILSKAGTPRRPGANIQGFIFAMFNENQKPAGEEQHWGLFYPNMQPVYGLFS